MFGEFVQIGQRSNDGVDTKSIQNFGLVNTPNECRYFECIPFGMAEQTFEDGTPDIPCPESVGEFLDSLQKPISYQ